MDTLLVAVPKRSMCKQDHVSERDARLQESWLRASLERVIQELPSLGVAFAVRSGCWGNSVSTNLFWATSTPPKQEACFIHQHSDSSGGVIVFGELLDGSPPAATIWKTYLEAGPMAVRLLDGCFSAIIYDPRRNTIEVVSDMLGQRGWRMVEAEDAYWFSPHDACLVACGVARVRFDPVSALSCLVVENSLGAHSLLTDIKGLEGNDWISISQLSGAVHRRCVKLESSKRIGQADRAAQRECREWVVERIVSAAASWADAERQLRCELTAGLDSRATLACLLGAGAEGQCVALTNGRVNDLDVRTAAKLARIAGIPHVIGGDSVDDAEHFHASSLLRSFATNGETDAKRATKGLPEWNPQGPIRVEGSSGEIFRGFFYPYFGPTGIAPDNPERLVDVLLKRRCRRFATTPVADMHLRELLRTRMLGCFAEYEAISTNGNDMLDLFYLFERCAHWGAHVRRATWSTSRNVFLVPTAIRAAYQLPAPLGFWANVHAELIRRYFPRSRRVLINGATTVHLEGPGRIRMASRLGLTVARAVADRMHGARRSAASEAGPFSGGTYSLVHDYLSSSDSVFMQTLGKRGAGDILRQHEQRRTHTALIGYAITQDVYRELILRLVPTDLATTRS